MIRISATTLESYRLWRDPNQEWMPEEKLIESIKGIWQPDLKVQMGSAFGAILEDPDRYLVPGGFEAQGISFGLDVVEPCLAVIDRRGTFEAKTTKAYDDCLVVSKADHVCGLVLSEFKTTWGSFDVSRYLDSYQWRFMADAFQPSRITYHVFCLSHSESNDVISLRSVETFSVYPYAGLHEDCAALVREFRGYLVARGLDGILRARQESAA